MLTWEQAQELKVGDTVELLGHDDKWSVSVIKWIEYHLDHGIPDRLKFTLDGRLDITIVKDRSLTWVRLPKTDTLTVSSITPSKDTVIVGLPPEAKPSESSHFTKDRNTVIVESDLSGSPPIHESALILTTSDPGKFDCVTVPGGANVWYNERTDTLLVTGGTLSKEDIARLEEYVEQVRCEPGDNPIRLAAEINIDEKTVMDPRLTGTTSGRFSSEPNVANTPKPQHTKGDPVVFTVLGEPVEVQDRNGRPLRVGDEVAIERSGLPMLKGKITDWEEVVLGGADRQDFRIWTYVGPNTEAMQKAFEIWVAFNFLPPPHGWVRSTVHRIKNVYKVQSRPELTMKDLKETLDGMPAGLDIRSDCTPTVSGRFKDACGNEISIGEVVHVGGGVPEAGLEFTVTQLHDVYDKQLVRGIDHSQAGETHEFPAGMLERVRTADGFQIIQRTKVEKIVPERDLVKPPPPPPMCVTAPWGTICLADKYGRQLFIGDHVRFAWEGFTASSRVGRIVRYEIAPNTPARLNVLLDTDDWEKTHTERLIEPETPSDTDVDRKPLYRTELEWVSPADAARDRAPKAVAKPSTEQHYSHDSPRPPLAPSEHCHRDAPCPDNWHRPMNLGNLLGEPGTFKSLRQQHIEDRWGPLQEIEECKEHGNRGCMCPRKSK
jgi:hypothetical protein